jgi:hypothetical protein
MDDPMTDELRLQAAELTRLADGSLPDARQAELRAQIQQSPELAADLAEQQRAVTMLRALDHPAPASLRGRIDELSSARGPRTARRWRRALVLPGATAIAVVVAAIVVLIGGGSSAPTVPAAARLALASATLPAPRVDPAQRSNLSLQAAGIPFPSWGAKAGWKTTGARSDVLDGRRITTVFYVGRDGDRIGYAISSGPPLAGINGDTVTRYGVRFTLAQQGLARVITWVRSGHTCVIAGNSVSYATLLALAGADERQVVSSRAAVAEPTAAWL